MEPLRPEDISIQYTKNLISLYNVRIRRDLLLQLGIPFVVEYGVIESIDIKAPRRRPSQEYPSMLTISGVFIQLGCVPEKQMYPPEYGKRVGNRKKGKKEEPPNSEGLQQQRTEEKKGASGRATPREDEDEEELQPPTDYSQSENVYKYFLNEADISTRWRTVLSDIFAFLHGGQSAKGFIESIISKFTQFVKVSNELVYSKRTSTYPSLLCTGEC